MEIPCLAYLEPKPMQYQSQNVWKTRLYAKIREGSKCFWYLTLEKNRLLNTFYKNHRSISVRHCIDLEHVSIATLQLVAKLGFWTAHYRFVMVRIPEEISIYFFSVLAVYSFFCLYTALTLTVNLTFDMFALYISATNLQSRVPPVLLFVCLWRI